MGEVTIDSIQIEIESNSTNASRGLDALAGSLEKLKKNGSLGLDYGIKIRCLFKAPYFLVIIYISAAHFALPCTGKGDELLLFE